MEEMLIALFNLPIGRSAPFSTVWVLSFQGKNSLPVGQITASCHKGCRPTGADRPFLTCILQSLTRYDLFKKIDVLSGYNAVSVKIGAILKLQTSQSTGGNSDREIQIL